MIRSILSYRKARVFLILLVGLLIEAGNVEGATYYSKVTGNANVLTTWGLNTDGNGTAPSNFTTSGDIFILQIGQTKITNGNWTIGIGVTLQIDGTLSINGNNDQVNINGTVVFTNSSATQVLLGGNGSGNDFILNSGAILKTNNINGLQGTNCSLPTNASKKTVTLNSGANYEFNGAAQSTLGLPTTVNNLTLSGNGTKTAHGVLTIIGTTTLAGITLNTGGFSSSFGVLAMSSSSTIALGTGNHTLTFSNSSAASWAGTLTIKGWTGTAGASGTSGKVVVGTGGLSAIQLNNITFEGFDPGAMLVSGEVVPFVSASKPVITSALTASSVYGVSTSYQITASNAPTSFSATGLPTGMSINPSNGLITVGATTAAGIYSILISATNSKGTGSATISYTVSPAPLTITANNQSKCFGQTLSFTGVEFTSVGLVNNDVVSSVTLTSAGSGTGAATGSYSIAPSAATGSNLNNYSITYSSAGTLTVTGAPTITSTSPGSRCGAGAVVISATASSGILNWYDAPTGGNFVGTGSPFTTPVISSTTTFYVDATDGSCTSGARTPVLASIISSPSITAGGGGSFCAGTNVSLTSNGTNITNQYWTGPNNFYSLNQNPVISDVTAAMSGTYIVTGSSLSTVNLVTNGNFSLGKTGFTTEYTLADQTSSGLNPEGAYDVVALPSSRHSNFCSCGDHTSGSGLQMVINGAGTESVIWSQSVNVVPNTTYQFTYWVQTVVNGNDSNPSKIQLFVNGSNAGVVYTANATTGVWTQFTYNWTSGPGITTAKLDLKNENFAPGGNDFALDDIEFHQACWATSSVNVTIDPISVGGIVSGGTTICSGGTSGLLTLSGQTGTITKWQSSVSPFSSWTDIANTGTTYTSGILTQTTRFRAVVTNGVCSPATSTATTVTVNSLPAPPTANNLTITYDGSSYSATASVLSGETIDWYTLSSGGSPTSAPTGKNVGIYKAWAETRNIATGCVSSSRTEVTLTINARPLIITADNKIKVYDGSPFSSFTANYNGFVNGETSTVLSGTLSFSGSAITAKNAGTGYVITPGGLTSSNYTINYANGTLDISKATVIPSVTANNKCYDGTALATLGNKILSGVIAPDVVSLDVSAASFSDGLAGTNKVVTSAGLSLSGPGAGNYTLSSTTASTTATIYALPVPTVSGDTSPCEDAESVVYNTETGMNGYNWTISAEGQITAGQGTNSIVVTWISAGDGTVEVDYTNGNGCSGTKSVAVTVHPKPLIGSFN